MDELQPIAERRKQSVTRPCIQAQAEPYLENFVPEQIVHAIEDILGDVVKAELCHALNLRKRWQGDGRAACACACAYVCA